MKNFFKQWSFLLALVYFIDTDTSIITTLNKNDPNPIFSTIYPYTYLYQNEKEYMKERTDCCDPQYFSLTVTPFFQRACEGKNLDKKDAELGDLTGKWNMIAVLPFNGCTASMDIPDAPSLEAIPQELCNVRDNLLNCINCIITPTGSCSSPNELQSIEGLLSLQGPKELFGFFSVPIKYRKVGVRFDANVRIFRNFGFSFQTGVADISQVAQFIDQTITPTNCNVGDCTVPNCPPLINPHLTCDNPFTANKLSTEQWNQVADCVHIELMNKLDRIAKSLGIDLCNFNKTAIEDVHFEFWWRKAFPISKDCEVGPCQEPNCWTPFLFAPFVSIGASMATGPKADPNKPLSLPFGNNGHNALRFNAGFTFDFYETIDVGMHSGLSYFFKECFKDYRVPTTQFQNGIIPYTTDVEIKPGATWHIGIVMNAYHFCDCLSAWIEYLYISHLKDKICLTKENPRGVFKPEVLECRSPWMVQVVNGGINYDFSPNFAIGLGVQIPVDRRNAYKSTTFFGSFVYTY